ncbi:hypothetical protein [Demequina sp. NBRC 110052]|nr:hypothetical protein [Demequina sp. NBRC 110052]
MIGSNVFSIFYRKSASTSYANLPAPIRDEVLAAMEATSRTDIR